MKREWLGIIIMSNTVKCQYQLLIAKGVREPLEKMSLRILYLDDHARPGLKFVLSGFKYGRI